MMTDNGIQLTVLSAGISFVVVGTTIAQITSSAYPANGVESIDTIDGYTLFSTATNNPSPVYDKAVDITAITKANPAVVTATAHGLVDNQQTLIQSVGGMTELNDRQFTILKVDDDTFQLVGEDSTNYSAYTSGGTSKRIIAQGNGQWFVSALYDSANIDALQFASAESKPDPLLRVLVVNREVWLFGSESLEPWQDTGASSQTFPFERVTGAVMDRGTAAALSCTSLTGTAFWLGDDLIVYAAAGYTPSRISNYAVEEFLRKAGDAGQVSDAFAFTYTQAGHSFYILTLPSFGMTFAYDIGTQIWHERRSGTQLTPAVWNVTCIVPWNQTLYVGMQSGAVGILDMDTFTELGDPIRRAAITPPFYLDGKRGILTTVEVECELGVGLNTGQGSDPEVMLRFSDDGAATWSNQRTMSIGRTGDRIDRAIARRLGMFRQRALEISISDPVKTSLYGIRVEAVAASS
jgi:hypothetical protein